VAEQSVGADQKILTNRGKGAKFWFLILLRQIFPEFGGLGAFDF